MMTPNDYIECKETIEQLCKENAELKQELAEHESRFEMCHKRTLEADKLWQIAHNQPDTFPDLGELIEWLLLRLKNQETVIEATRATVKAKDALIEQMREALVAAKNDGKMQSAITYQLIKAALSTAERGEG